MSGDLTGLCLYMQSLLSWYYQRMAYLPALFVRVLLFPNYSYIYIIAYLCVYLSFWNILTHTLNISVENQSEMTNDHLEFCR